MLLCCALKNVYLMRTQDALKPYRKWILFRLVFCPCMSVARRPAVVRSKETLPGRGGDSLGVRRPATDGKPELARSESDVSDHTKDLQRNLMRQVHGDVIDRPDMLMHDETRSPDAIGSLLNRGISELTKVTRSRYTVFAFGFPSTVRIP